MLLAFLLCLPASTTLYAQDIHIVTEDFPPYNYKDHGKLTGVGAEVVLAVLEEINIDLDIEVYPWTRAYRMARDEENTLVFSMARTEDRENLFQWVGTIAPINTCVFRLNERDSIKANNVEEAKQYVIGTQQDTPANTLLQEKGFVVGKNLHTNIHIIYSLKMLMESRLDLVGYPELSVYYQIRKEGYEPKRLLKKLFCLSEIHHAYMAFGNKTSKTIVERFRTGLQAIKNNGTHQKILNKYLD